MQKGSGNTMFAVVGTVIWAPLVIFFGRMAWIHFHVHNNIAQGLVAVWVIVFFSLVWFFLCIKPLLKKEGATA